MQFNTQDNPALNQFSEMNPFFINQLHNYQQKNYVQDSLTQRQMLAEPEKPFGSYITNNSYIDNTSLTDNLLPDKSKSLKTLVGAINKEIDERLNMKEDIMTRIDIDIVKCDNYLLEIEGIVRYNPDIGKRRTSMEHEIFGMEREKRMEETACWRDLVFLKKDLFETLKEYWSAVNREDMLLENNTGVK